MKLFIANKYAAAAFALAAVATLVAAPAFAQNSVVGDRIGNARPSHYDPKTLKQVTGWTAEVAAQQEAPAPRKLYVRTTQSSRNARTNS